ncbi:unnamed protein product [Adineta steineri]|uniref:Uncharacterized protein n=1 Tax=Adineta steineri TaxID=433720 RepID=A0A814DMQ1_9BILA|nr:unnamed protein product [Adineta steineri]CAF1325820.1 unnamed protein product [Adineta steineri]CAF1368486.1 unnamed protein product [Adineta steineri]
MDVPANEPHDYLFKLLCIGEANVGKTTFLHQYIHDNFANFRSTVGLDVFEKCITTPDNQNILLQLWDTAGQERYRSLTKSLFRDSMGFLLLFDVTNESSFLTIQDWLTYVDTYTGVDDNLRPPILLIGNKIDLVTNRVIDTMRAQQLANELQITYIETSAVTGTNVQETLRLLVKNVFDFMEQSMKKYYPKSPAITLTADEEKHKRRTSVQLINKLSGKKHSCSCT